MLDLDIPVTTSPGMWAALGRACPWPRRLPTAEAVPRELMAAATCTPDSPVPGGTLGAHLSDTHETVLLVNRREGTRLAHSTISGQQEKIKICFSFRLVLLNCATKPTLSKQKSQRSPRRWY